LATDPSSRFKLLLYCPFYRFFDGLKELKYSTQLMYLI